MAKLKNFFAGLKKSTVITVISCISFVLITFFVLLFLIKNPITPSEKVISSVGRESIYHEVTTAPPVTEPAPVQTTVTTTTAVQTTTQTTTATTEYVYTVTTVSGFLAGGNIPTDDDFYTDNYYYSGYDDTSDDSDDNSDDYSWSDDDYSYDYSNYDYDYDDYSYNDYDYDYNDYGYSEW